MVTANKKIVYDHLECEVRCLSTDEKPNDVPNGTPLVEINTGKLFMFDAETGTWYEVQ